VNLSDLPSGAATVKIWHPQARMAGNEVTYKTALTGGTNDRRFALAMRAK
jgi:hypothetical protein